MKSQIAIAQVFMSKYWTGLWMKKKKNKKMVNEKHFENNAGKKQENMNSNLTSNK